MQRYLANWQQIYKYFLRAFSGISVIVLITIAFAKDIVAELALNEMN